MKRYDYLAAELFGYSYYHYQDKLDIGHIRFTRYMPNMVRDLERGINASWSDEKIAEKLDIELDQVSDFKESYHRATNIVDKNPPLRMFEEGIKSVIEIVFENDEFSEELKGKLVDQLMYRAKDFEFRLKEEIEFIQEVDREEY